MPGDDKPDTLEYARPRRRITGKTVLMLVAIGLVIVTWIVAMLAAAMTFQMR